MAKFVVGLGQRVRLTPTVCFIKHLRFDCGLFDTFRSLPPTLKREWESGEQKNGGIFTRHLFNSVDRTKYQIQIPLPPKIDPSVTMMQVAIILPLFGAFFRWKRSRMLPTVTLAVAKSKLKSCARSWKCRCCRSLNSTFAHLYFLYVAWKIHQSWYWPAEGNSLLWTTGYRQDPLCSSRGQQNGCDIYSSYRFWVGAKVFSALQIAYGSSGGIFSSSNSPFSLDMLVKVLAWSVNCLKWRDPKRRASSFSMKLMPLAVICSCLLIFVNRSSFWWRCRRWQWSPKNHVGANQSIGWFRSSRQH